MPIMSIVSGEDPSTQQAHVLNTKYSGLSVHICTWIFLPSVKQRWTCSLVVGLCLVFLGNYEKEIRYVENHS